MEKDLAPEKTRNMMHLDLLVEELLQPSFLAVLGHAKLRPACDAEHMILSLLPQSCFCSYQRSSSINPSEPN